MRRTISRSQILFFGLVLAALTLFLVPDDHVAGLRTRVLSALSPVMNPLAVRQRNHAPVPALIAVPVPATPQQPAKPAPPPENHTERLDELTAANIRLQSELNRLRDAFADRLPHAPDAKSIPAGVIARSVLWQEPLLGLNRGEADGIRLHSGVMHRGAVAGRIVATGKNASSMALLTHRGMSIAARLADCRIEGVLQGCKDAVNGEKLCRLAVIAREIDVKVGEQVVTSGFDGAFPPGMWLGNVVSLKKTGDVQWEVAVRPACVDSAIEVVQVLNCKLPDVPWPVVNTKTPPRKK